MISCRCRAGSASSAARTYPTNSFATVWSSGRNRRDGGTLQWPASGCPGGCIRPASGSPSDVPNTSCSRIRDSRLRWRDAVFLTIPNSQVATDERPSNAAEDLSTCTHASCTASSATAGEFTMVRAKFTIGRWWSRTNAANGTPPTRCRGSAPSNDANGVKRIRLVPNAIGLPTATAPG